MNGKDTGFTYMGLLVLMIVAGIAMTSAGTYWQTIVKREKEAELLYRGGQIRLAIESYYKNVPGGQGAAYPRRLKDLLKDPRYPGVRRYLRKLYKNPMVGDGEWMIIYDSKHGIKGVYSKSKHVPLKVANFLPEEEDFEKAETYSDWKFVYSPKETKPSDRNNQS